MSIHEIIAKIKNTITEQVTEDVYVVAIIVLIGFAGFGLGRLSIIDGQKTPVTIEYEALSANILTSIQNETINDNNKPLVAGGLLVASKNGSKYHFPWCSGAKRMKEENKIWFESKKQAERAGYEPAKNCNGL